MQKAFECLTEGQVLAGIDEYIDSIREHIQDFSTVIHNYSILGNLSGLKVSNQQKSPDSKR